MANEQIKDQDEKTTPAGTDVFAIDDGATDITYKVQLVNLAVYVWNYLTTLTAKTTLVDADQLALADSAASNAAKKITWQNVMAQAAAYTQTLTNKTLTAPVIADFTNAAHDHGDADDGGAIVAASDTVAGAVELATTAETNTGTDAARAVTPDGLAGSYAGTKAFGATIMSGAITTGDGKFYLPPIPASMNGMNIVSVVVSVRTKSTSGTPTFQFARGRQANATSAHTYADMLSTRVTIDANEYSSLNATTAAVIDTSNDDLATGDLIRCDIDVAGTGTTDAMVTFEARLP